MRFMICILLLASCASPEPEISREKAEGILRAFSYQNIVLYADPDGWVGTANHGPNTYTLKVKIDNHGILTFYPDQT